MRPQRCAGRPSSGEPAPQISGLWMGGEGKRSGVPVSHAFFCPLAIRGRQLTSAFGELLLWSEPEAGFAQLGALQWTSRSVQAMNYCEDQGMGGGHSSA